MTPSPISIGFQTWDAPLGRLFIAADHDALRAIAFDSNWARIRATLGTVQAQTNPLIAQTITQLQAYFAGQRQTFELPLHLNGTPFQQRTWQTLRNIPYGETRSYSEQANAVGQPQAVRAIGHSNSLNPISIVIPCHRVIAKSGKLAGYAGGLEAKQFLLALEQRYC
jgi:methylated-DNA-[protein]-cysteine S-methyltransferase